MTARYLTELHLGSRGFQSSGCKRLTHHFSFLSGVINVSDSFCSLARAIQLDNNYAILLSVKCLLLLLCAVIPCQLENETDHNIGFSFSKSALYANYLILQVDLVVKHHDQRVLLLWWKVARQWLYNSERFVFDFNHLWCDDVSVLWLEEIIQPWWRGSYFPAAFSTLTLSHDTAA